MFSDPIHPTHPIQSTSALGICWNSCPLGIAGASKHKLYRRIVGQLLWLSSIIGQTFSSL